MLGLLVQIIISGRPPFNHGDPGRRWTVRVTDVASARTRPSRGAVAQAGSVGLAGDGQGGQAQTIMNGDESVRVDGGPLREAAK